MKWRKEMILMNMKSSSLNAVKTVKLIKHMPNTLSGNISNSLTNVCLYLFSETEG